MASPLIKQPALLSLVLFSVHVSVLVDCRAMLLNAKQRPREPQQRSFHAVPRAAAVTVGRFYLEPRKPVKRGINKNFGGILPVKTDTGKFVSRFDLRKKRLLCINSKRKRYDSKQKKKDDCLFYRVWLDLMKPRGVFRAQLLKIKTAELHGAHKPPEPPSALMDPLVKRKRRSEEVNPSDPLGSHSLPSRSAKRYKDPSHGPHEQDQAGAVSRESIASCDDPLRVLQPHGPISPVKTNIAEWAEH